MRFNESLSESLNPYPRLNVKFRMLKKSAGPYLVDPKGPYADALRRAVKDALGKECVFGRSGGSIGAAGIMQKHLHVPIIFFGVSLPEHGYHAPNEYFEWEQACAGILVFGNYFDQIASIGTLGN